MTQLYAWVVLEVKKDDRKLGYDNISEDTVRMSY